MIDDTCYFADASRQNDTDDDLCFVSKVFNQEQTDLNKLYQLIQDAKSANPFFMTTPVVGHTFMRAVQMNLTDIIKCLIAGGASVNMLFRGRTMLHVAVKTENTQMLSFLLCLDGVDRDKRDVEMMTPLMEAAKGRPACLKILLDAGCCLNLRDSKGLVAFHHTIHGCRAKREDVIQCLDIFLASGANINVQDTWGESCLHKAIKKSNHWFMQWLVFNNCDVNLCGPKLHLTTSPLPGLKISKASPFLYAFQMANRVLVEVLIACGCDFRKHYNTLEFCKGYRLLHQSFQKALINVDSLQALSRTIIRQHLSTNIVQESAHLGLPVALQRYILCTEELSVLDSYG